MLQRILVGLDGSPLAESILPFITALAKGLGASVTLLHVTALPDDVRLDGGDGRAAFQDRIRLASQAATDYLHSVQRTMGDTGVPVTVALAAGEPAGELLSYAEREAMDLIALATHGRSGLQRWRFGSVADKVLHTANVPLLLVRPAEGQSVAAGVERLVVPLDGSVLSEAAVPFAETLAGRFGVPVTLLRSVEPFYVFGVTDAAKPEDDEALGSIRDALHQYLEGQAQGLRERGVTVETRALFGPAAQTIVDEAQSRQGDLVVMTTAGRGAVMGALLGSVARQVVYNIGMPVLLVRSNVSNLPAAGR
ncbi:MAG: universal stress protein [Chloroflexi bacterium]|nr:universal stress protein [Chloroflexota bacterium]